MLAFLEDVRAKLEAIETAGERKAKLERDLAQASAAYRERGSGADQREKSGGARNWRRKWRPSWIPWRLKAPCFA